MNRKKFLHQILKTILDNSVFTTEFDSATDNGDGSFTLTGVCDFHHVTKGRSVEVTGNTCVIDDFDTDAGTITLTGYTDYGVPGSFVVPNPFFFHGTPVQTENETDKIDSIQEKLPMIYLLEPPTIDEDDDESSSIGRTITCKLCFLTEADHQNWSTDQAYKYAIRPMENLKDDFKVLLGKSGLFYSIEQTDSVKHYTKFGINIQDFGVKNQYFTEALAGVGMDIKLEILRETDCDDCEDSLSLSDGCPDCPDCEEQIMSENLIDWDNVIERDADAVSYPLGTGWIRTTNTDGTYRLTHANQGDGQTLLFRLPEPSPINTTYFLTMKVVSDTAGVELEDFGIIVNVDGSDYFPKIDDSYTYARTFLRDTDNPPSGPVEFYLNLNTIDAPAGWKGYIDDIQIRTIPTLFFT